MSKNDDVKFEADLQASSPFLQDKDGEGMRRRGPWSAWNLSGAGVATWQRAVATLENKAYSSCMLYAHYTTVFTFAQESPAHLLHLQMFDHSISIFLPRQALIR